MASADAVEQRLERRLVVLERHRVGAAADAAAAAGEHRAEQRAEGEVQEVDDAGRVPLTSGGLASLITV